MKIISILLPLWLLSTSAYASNIRSSLQHDAAAAKDVVPARVFNSGRINLTGPSKAPVTFQMEGALREPRQPSTRQYRLGAVPPDGVIDLVAHCGAQPNGDVLEPITKAFSDACACPTGAKILIPSGVFNLGQVDFTGPCKGPITFQLDGTLKAPADPAVFKDEWWIRLDNINFLTITGTGIFDGNGVAAWAGSDCEEEASCEGMPISVRLDSINNSLVTGVTSKDSKNFNFNMHRCNNVTFDKVRVETAPGSVNTDGIHLSMSSNIKIINTILHVGDDCVSVGDGTTALEVSKVECGPGHGISVGSLGKYHDEVPLKGLVFRDCQLINTKNGARLKSWPGLFPNTCEDVLFEAFTMTNVSNPVILDQSYCPHGKCKQGEPTKVKMTNIVFRNIKGSSADHDAVQILCSPGMCENVELADIDLTYDGPKKNNFSSFCTNIKPKISPPLNPRGSTCV